MKNIVVIIAGLLTLTLLFFVSAGRSPALSGFTLSGSDDPAAAAERVLDLAGVDRGICAVVAGENAGSAVQEFATGLSLELARRSEFLVYLQVKGEAALARFCRIVDSAGLYGTRVFVEKGDLSRIHLADNLTDFLVVAGQAEELPDAEALRVLRPGGMAFLGDNVLEKPALEGADDWSHPFHGPDNNPQSGDLLARAPYLTQFLADPRYAPVPQVAVASCGRVFKAFGHVAFKAREEPWLNVLAAFNGYNGALLWTRALKPGIMVHRSTIIATPDTVFLGDDESCKKIDAATGALKGEIRVPEGIAGGAFWKWMALEEGVLYALVGEDEFRDPVKRHKRETHGWPWDDISEGFNAPENPWGFGRTVVAYDAESHELLWSHREDEPVDSRALCMKGGRLYLFRPSGYLACLDAGTGEQLWRKSAAEELPENEEAERSTLSLRLESIDRKTGVVRINGVDTRFPEAPFEWDWEDGSPGEEGFLPREHTYEDTGKAYLVRVKARYSDGSTDEAELHVSFAGSRLFEPGDELGLFEALGPHLKRQGWSTNWRTAAYLKCSDDALYFSGPQVGKLLAVSAKDGRVLWENAYANFQLVLRDEGLYGISGPWGTHMSTLFDPMTGDVLEQIGIGRRACSRPSGSADAIFFRAAGGSVRLDIESLQPQWISPMRAQCQDGVMIANGLLYWWPSVCDCNLSIYGVTCLGPAGEGFDFYAQADEAERLEKFARKMNVRGAAGKRLKAAGAADWPAFRANNSCTASTEASVPKECGQLWRVAPEHSFRPTAPTAACGLVFLSGSRGDVLCLDASTGREQWRAFTGGAVRIPPTIRNGRALVGSGDGWIYSFDARTGQLSWRFRAAPEERKIPVYGELLSTWPVASGVLVEDGVAYAAAGINNFDGVHLFALDAETGAIKWQNSTSGHLDREARTGVGVQGHLLLHAGKLYLAGGNAVSPAVYDITDGRCLNSAEQLSECTAKGSRGRELFLIGDEVVACGRPYYANPAHVVYDSDVFNKLLVAPVKGGLGGKDRGRDRDILWMNNHELLCYPRIERELLSACVADRSEQGWFSYNWGALDLPGVEPVWSDAFEGSVAVAIGRNAVVVATRSNLHALDIDSGRILWTQPLPAAPVPWGLALDGGGRIVVTLEGGVVLCFG